MRKELLADAVVITRRLLQMVLSTRLHNSLQHRRTHMADTDIKNNTIIMVGIYKIRWCSTDYVRCISRNLVAFGIRLAQREPQQQHVYRFTCAHRDRVELKFDNSFRSITPNILQRNLRGTRLNLMKFRFWVRSEIAPLLPFTCECEKSHSNSIVTLSWAHIAGLNPCAPNFVF